MYFNLLLFYIEPSVGFWISWILMKENSKLEVFPTSADLTFDNIYIYILRGIWDMVGCYLFSLGLVCDEVVGFGLWYLTLLFSAYPILICWLPLCLKKAAKEYLKEGRKETKIPVDFLL